MNAAPKPTSTKTIPVFRIQLQKSSRVSLQIYYLSLGKRIFFVSGGADLLGSQPSIRGTFPRLIKIHKRRTTTRKTQSHKAGREQDTVQLMVAVGIKDTERNKCQPCHHTCDYRHP